MKRFHLNLAQHFPTLHSLLSLFSTVPWLFGYYIDTGILPSVQRTCIWAPRTGPIPLSCPSQLTSNHVNIMNGFQVYSSAATLHFRNVCIHVPMSMLESHTLKNTRKKYFPKYCFQGYLLCFLKVSFLFLKD